MSKARPITREGMKSPSMTDEVKQQRRNKRYQLVYLNKLISLKASVTVDILPDDAVDGEDVEAVVCTSIAECKQGYRVYRWQEDEHGPIIIDTSRFAVAIHPNQAKEQVDCLNSLIKHNAVVSVALLEHLEPVQLSQVALYGDRCFKVTYHSADEEKTNKIIGWNNFFEVSVR